MIGVGSYRCFSVERPMPSSKTISLLFNLAFLRLWNGRDEFSETAVIDDAICRLTRRIKFPMARGVFVRRV